MRIDLKDPRVNEAIDFVKNNHNLPADKEFYEFFEEQYHCKIFSDPEDPFCLSLGYLDISEEKYSNWFVLQFGEGK
jgi:hypothetical protein